MERRQFLKVLAGVALAPSVVMAKQQKPVATLSIAGKKIADITSFSFVEGEGIREPIGVLTNVRRSENAVTAEGRLFDSRYAAFVKATLQSVANGLGESYEKLIEDFDGVSYD